MKRIAAFFAREGNYIRDASVEDSNIHLMAEWLYREAGRLITPDPELWLKVLNPEIRDSIKAFQANIERARAFWRIQPYLIEHAVTNVSKLCYETWSVTGKPFLDSPEKDAALAETIVNRLNDQFQKRFAETGSRDIAAGYDFERALDRFDVFLRNESDFEREVFGVFLSQIVASWTAFETLSGDLWQAVVVCDPEAIEKPELHSFQSLEKLRKAYAALLPQSRKIDGILSDVGLRKLNLVRNVALHKAGIVDQKFLKGAAEISWGVPDELNKPLQLEGVRVRDLINPVIQTSLNLISAVDEWITIKRQSRKGER